MNRAHEGEADPRGASAAAGRPEPALVSVIVPVHDRFELAERAIRSVAAQTYRPLELIVVDDASRHSVPPPAGRARFRCEARAPGDELRPRRRPRRRPAAGARRVRRLSRLRRFLGAGPSRFARGEAPDVSGNGHGLRLDDGDARRERARVAAVDRGILRGDSADAPLEAPVAHERLPLAPRSGRRDGRLDADLALGGPRARRARGMSGSEAHPRSRADLLRGGRLTGSAVREPRGPAAHRGLRPRDAVDRPSHPRDELVR